MCSAVQAKETLNRRHRGTMHSRTAVQSRRRETEADASFEFDDPSTASLDKNSSGGSLYICVDSLGSGDPFDGDVDLAV